MSLAVVRSRAQLGIQAPEVIVEVHLTNGLPGFSIVGLPETGVRESKDRVRSAILNSRFDYPMRRITVNLAPADLPKEGGRYDLAIAVGILAASGQLPLPALEGCEVIGELTLSGQVRAVPGAVAAAIQLREGERALVLPRDNLSETRFVEGARLIGVDHLLTLCGHLTGESPLPLEPVRPLPSTPANGADLSEVRGQEQAKRALEVAAAGQHSLLMIGPPGTGKTMLASRLAGILPALSSDEWLEVAAIRSVCDRLQAPMRQQRPFRAPHHTASGVALVGGGSVPRPGEISLAHQGVLFLDELPEFDRRVLEVLREPLESGRICISRAARQVSYPARFQLVAAMNPCPCGYQGDSGGRCRCTPDQIRRYQGRISGPLLDRLDLQVEMRPLSFEQLQGGAGQPCESSQQVRARVAQARRRQLERRGKVNSLLSSAELEQDCSLERENLDLMKQALERLRLSARAYHRVLRVARTLADLEGSERVGKPHLLESLGYRRLDRLPES